MSRGTAYSFKHIVISKVSSQHLITLQSFELFWFIICSKPLRVLDDWSVYFYFYCTELSWLQYTHKLVSSVNICIEL